MHKDIRVNDIVRDRDGIEYRVIERNDCDAGFKCVPVKPVNGTWFYDGDVDVVYRENN